MSNLAIKEDIPESAELIYHQVQPDTQLELALCKTQYSNETRPWSLTVAQLIEYISPPAKISATKEGEGFLIGPCLPTRHKANLPWACVAVIDADKTVLPSGATEDGAPDPSVVADELLRNNLAHLLYTTYSHGTGRGNRYRIIIPIPLASEHELSALVTFYAEVLHKAGIPLALSEESSRWSQLWACPRVSGDQAPYLARVHLGVVPNPNQLARIYGLLDEDGNPKTTTLPPLSRDDVGRTEDSVIWLFNHYHQLADVLVQAGYTFASQAIQYGHAGAPVAITRYRPPGDEPHNAPGVVVFHDEQLGDRVYSHHTKDPLCNGHANDAFGAWSILTGLRGADAHVMAIEMVQAAVAAELNTNYPSVMEGSTKFKIGNRHIDEAGGETYVFMSWGDFKMLQSNTGRVPVVKQGEDGLQKVVFIDRPSFWISSRDRIAYNGLVYEPCSILEPPVRDIYRTDCTEGRPYFNTFRGWGVSPFKGRWPHLEWHFRNSFFSNDEEQYQYFLNWMAHLVQEPLKKPGVAIVLTGRKGWGKSAPMATLARKLGANAIVLGNSKLLTGQFNGHLTSKLFLLLEEAFWSGDRRAEGPLKHMITDSWTTYEKKGQDAVAGASYVRIVMITNDDHVAPASSDERRYFVPTMSAASKERDEMGGRKGGFFPQLFTEMENGGMEAFLWDMAHRKVDHAMIPNVPETQGLKQQRALSLQGMEAWMLSCLISGYFESTRGGIIIWSTAGCTVPMEHLIDSITRVCSKFDVERGIEFRFNDLLKKVFGGLVTRAGRQISFAGLDECRAVFAKHYKLPDNTFRMVSAKLDRESHSDNVVNMRM